MATDVECGWTSKCRSATHLLAPAECSRCHIVTAFRKPAVRYVARQDFPREGADDLLCFQCAEVYRAIFVISRWYHGVCNRKYAAITIQRYARGWLTRQLAAYREFRRRLSSHLRRAPPSRFQRVVNWHRRNRTAFVFIFCFACSRCSFAIILFPKAFKELGSNFFSVALLAVLGTYVEMRLFRALYQHAVSHNFHSIDQALGNVTGGQRWWRTVLQLTYCVNCLIISCAMYANICLLVAAGDHPFFAASPPPNASAYWLLGLCPFLPLLLFRPSEKIQVIAEHLSAAFTLLAFLVFIVAVCITPWWKSVPTYFFYAPVNWSICAWSKGASFLFVVFLQDTLDAPLAAVALSTGKSFGGTVSAAVWVAALVNFAVGLMFSFTVLLQTTILRIAQVLWLASLIISLYVNLRRAQHHLHGLTAHMKHWWQRLAARRRRQTRGVVAWNFLGMPDVPYQLAAPSGHDLISWRVLWAQLLPGKIPSDDSSQTSESFKAVVPAAYKTLSRWASYRSAPWASPNDSNPSESMTPLLSTRSVSETPRMPFGFIRRPVHSTSTGLDVARATTFVPQRQYISDAVLFALSGVTALILVCILVAVGLSKSIHYAAHFWTACFGITLAWHTTFHVYAVLGISRAANWEKGRPGVGQQTSSWSVTGSMINTRRRSQTQLNVGDFILVASVFLLAAGGAFCQWQS